MPINPEIIAGTNAWTTDGHKVYVHAVVGQQYLVSKIYYNSGSYDEPEYEYNGSECYFVSQLHTEAPEPVISPQQQSLMEQEQRLRAEIQELQQQKSALLESKGRVERETANYNGLNELLGLLNGTITHAVQFDSKGAIIQDFHDLMKTSSNTSRYHGLKLLTVYGTRHEGYNSETKVAQDFANPSLTFQLAKYDGSSDTQDVVLFESYDAAVEYVNTWFDNLITEWHQNPDSWSVNNQIDAMVGRFDFVSMPPSVVQYRKDVMTNNVANDISHLQEWINYYVDMLTSGDHLEIKRVTIPASPASQSTDEPA